MYRLLLSISDCILASTMDEALNRLSQPPFVDAVETVWVVGGVGIYGEAIKHPRCHRIYLTQVGKSEFRMVAFCLPSPLFTGTPPLYSLLL